MTSNDRAMSVDKKCRYGWLLPLSVIAFPEDVETPRPEATVSASEPEDEVEAVTGDEDVEDGGDEGQGDMFARSDFKAPVRRPPP